jgi:ankyrin repeat protein
MAARKSFGLASAILTAVVLTSTGAAAQVPLVEATRQGDLATVRTLLQGGADVNAAQGDGLTALHVAAETGRLEIARALIGARAKDDHRYVLRLHLALTFRCCPLIGRMPGFCRDSFTLRNSRIARLSRTALHDPPEPRVAGIPKSD